MLAYFADLLPLLICFSYTAYSPNAMYNFNFIFMFPVGK